MYRILRKLHGVGYQVEDVQGEYKSALPFKMIQNSNSTYLELLAHKLVDTITVNVLFLMILVIFCCCTPLLDPASFENGFPKREK
jgi:hypothetical protein